MNYRLSTAIAIAASAAILFGILGAALVAHAAIAAAPYGHAPAALTWRLPPDTLQRLPADGGAVRLPRGVTEVDVWTTDRRGAPRYRLRQRRGMFPERGSYCFTRARSRTCRVVRHGRLVVAGYGAARYGLVVYGWRS